MNDNVLVEPNRFDYATIPQLANHQERLKALRVQAAPAFTVDNVINLLEGRANLSLLERGPLRDLLLLRVTGFLPPETVNIDIANDSPLLLKLSCAYADLQKGPLRGELPEYLDDVFKVYAGLEPRWQEGPGAYGPIWKGAVLEKAGVAPEELFCGRSSHRDALSRYQGIEELHDADQPYRWAGNVSDYLFPPEVKEALGCLPYEYPEGIRAAIIKMGKASSCFNLDTQAMGEILRNIDAPGFTKLPVNAMRKKDFPWHDFTPRKALEMAEAQIRLFTGMMQVMLHYGVEPAPKEGHAEPMESFASTNEPVDLAGKMDALRTGSVTITLPRTPGHESIESVESRPLEGSAGVHHLLINDKPGRLMIDLGAYPLDEGGVTKMVSEITKAFCEHHRKPLSK